MNNPSVKPLVINTRPVPQAAEFSDLLRISGIEPVEIPLVFIQPIHTVDVRTLHSSDYSGIFFSSLNGLEIFFKGSTAAEKAEWHKLPLFTISGRVAEAWVREGGSIGFRSQKMSISGFLEEFLPDSISLPASWLHPCSLFTRLEPEAFRKKHVCVNNLPVYLPAVPEEAPHQIFEAMSRARGITFFSGSAVTNFFTCLRSTSPEMKISLPDHLKLFTAGASASAALEKEGIHQFHQAPKPGLQEICRLLTAELL